jgi:hypothetical protein
MCCFAGNVPSSFFGRLFAPKLHVSSTNIFARRSGPGVQALAYGMNLESSVELAMVLPLPVRVGSGEDAVRFIDLEEHSSMFSELAELFEVPVPAAGGGYRVALALARSQLVVYDVGSFIASYVPSRDDFDRLDPRFRLPAVLFDAVPEYASYGFAVFQLKPGKITVHPMAFTFETRASDELFFPTVHVHDGRFHATAEFDHALYYQHPDCREVSSQPLLSDFRGGEVGWRLPRSDYRELVQAAPVVRRVLRGTLPNRDTWIVG